MKHRIGTRCPIRTTVLLHPTGLAPVPGITRELSISGMFVAVEPRLFSANTVIDVELTLPGPDGLRTDRWQAMVIRQTADGIGLMFDRLRPPAVVALLKKLQTDPDFPSLVLPASVVEAKRAAGNERQPSARNQGDQQANR